jgi:hypothetical protein
MASGIDGMSRMTIGAFHSNETHVGVVAFWTRDAGTFYRVSEPVFTNFNKEITYREYNKRKALGL